MAVIDARGLEKAFSVRERAGRVKRTVRTVEAVSGIDLTVQPGETIGYVGPNGAGKSTTIKMFTGILAPSGGHLEVLGLEPVPRRMALARRIGVVFGQRTQLWWDLPLADSFALLHKVYRTDRARHRNNLDAFIDLLDLHSFLAMPVRQLSLGQRMRGELVAALLHDPDLVFLDEPTIGLDVVSKQAVRRFLRSLNQERGTTILLTTHDLSDVEDLCDRLVIIDRGSIVHDGPLPQFRERFGTHRTVVVDLIDDAATLHVEGAETVRTEGARRWLRFDRRQVTAADVIGRVVDQVRIRDLTVEEPAVEDLVRELYEGG
jgi:ABC-2 type transport system ATP-binding protein